MTNPNGARKTHHVATSSRLIRHDALQFVEQNWVRIWKRVNLGGLVQHQTELAAVLTEFVDLLEQANDPHS